MSDLDIEIDVPDDDDLTSSVRVLNGNWIPPWLFAAGVVLLGAFVAVLIGAFFLGRSREPAELLEAPSSATTPLASAAASPAIEQSLAAVSAWEAFARSGRLGDVEGTFHPDGPQYQMFVKAADEGRAEDLNFTAGNLTEWTAAGTTTVSMDLTVSGPAGDNVYPFDLVYLDGSGQVWTVVDRRAPGRAALPPSPEVIEAALANWNRLTAAMADGDGTAALAEVSEASQVLADQVTEAVATGAAPGTVALSDETLFDMLVQRAEAAGSTTPGAALVAFLDADQRQALAIGELTSWTQVGPDRIVASLRVVGEPMATVPFAATAEGWAFDLVGALETSGGQE